MKTVPTLAALALSLTCALAIASASAQTPKPATRQKAPAVDAAELFTTNCERCHGNGNSDIKELNFADGEWKHGASLADVTKTIADGVPGTAMLPWKEQLTQEEIAALAKYVRTFDKTLAPAGKARGTAGARRQKDGVRRK